ncbi:MAG: PD-(D/E)XK nuclease family protein, partial [Chloroflexi bacterium]|nr:PD-(D/E)XK nuclease family protein [Chloroflexota bacterium]
GGLSALEFALEPAGIPSRLDSAGLIYESQEARDLLNCLSAIDDPTDQVSVVAALRSPALACSDADLLEFVEAGGQFDYLADDDPPAGYTSGALAVLRDFHERRRWKSPAALIEEFVRERRLMEMALDGRHWRGRWMRYRFLIDRARAFAASGETSLRGYLAWTARQREEQARARETAVPESDEDAVRVMTVHGAKGLEFPILILAGLNSAPTHRPGPVLFDREGGKVEVKVGSRDLSFQTAGYAEVSELDKEREEEEDVRVMYVAATRARDHLIVSLYRNKRGSTSPAARIEQFMDGADNLWESLVPSAEADQGLIEQPGETGALDDDTSSARRQWEEERAVVYAASSRPFSAAATLLAQEAKDEQDIPDEPWRRGRAGTSIGRAVHAVLQVVDLRSGSGVEDIAMAQASAEGVPGRADDIGRLARRALESPLVKRALESGRWWRETPVAGPVGDGIVEGFIDLLFEEEDGFVIVDYKTDALGSDEEIERAMARYRLQGGGYALALSRATGVSVKEVSFLFLEPNRAVTVENLSGAMREAEEAAHALFAGGPART